jgi:hypothetical protein
VAAMAIPGVASKAPTGFLGAHRGVAGMSPGPPKARTSAVCSYMAETPYFNLTCFDPVDGSQSKIRSPLWSGAMRAWLPLSPPYFSH